MIVIVAMPLIEKIDPDIKHDHFQAMANQIYLGLKDRGRDVIYYGTKDYVLPPFNPATDFYICDWTRLNPTIPGDRTILLDNCNFNYQNREGIYDKFGYRINTNTSPHMRPDQLHQMIGLRGAVFMSNDVAIAKIASGNLETQEGYQWWQNNVGSNLKIMPHPIDKTFWSSYFDPKICGHKILVYQKSNKNSLEYIDLLRNLGYQEGRDYDITNHIDKNLPIKLTNINQQYRAVVNCSF